MKSKSSSIKINKLENDNSLPAEIKKLIGKSISRRNVFAGVGTAGAAAALLAFSLSFDDFIITNFNSGTVTTFPKFVYTAAARGIPAQANVIGSSMFFIALTVVVVGQVLSNKRKAKI